MTSQGDPSGSGLGGHSRVVYTGGVFDLLHVGHLRRIRGARGLGSWLVVGVQTDEAVLASKGHRPLLTTEERVEQIDALGWADEIVTYHSGTDGRIIEAVRPDVFVHGQEWLEEADRSAVLARLALCNAEVILLPRTPGVSSSDIRRRAADAESASL